MQAVLKVLEAVKLGDDAGALALLEDASVGALFPVNLRAVLLKAVAVRPNQAPMLRTVEHLLTQRGVRLADTTAFIIAIRTTFEAAFGGRNEVLEEPPSPERVLAAQQAGVALLRLLLRCGGGGAAAAAPVGTKEQPVLLESGDDMGPCTLATIAQLCEHHHFLGDAGSPREWLALPEALARELLGAGVAPATYAWAVIPLEPDALVDAFYEHNGQPPEEAMQDQLLPDMCPLHYFLARFYSHEPSAPAEDTEVPPSSTVRLLRMLTGYPGLPDCPPQLLRWTPELHAHFPPAFKAAARTLLLAAHRRGQANGERRLPQLPESCVQCVLEQAAAPLWQWLE